MSDNKSLKFFNHLDLESDLNPFINVQVLGLLIAVLMWSISILGLNLVLTTQTILIVIVWSFSVALYFNSFFKRKHLGHINIVSICIINIGLNQITAYFYAFNFPPFLWDEVAYTEALPKL
jgi:hypothetical protein